VEPPIEVAERSVEPARVGVAADPALAAVQVDPNNGWIVRVRDRGNQPIPELACLLRVQQEGDKHKVKTQELRTDAEGEFPVPQELWSAIADPGQSVTVEPQALLTQPAVLRLAGSPPASKVSEIWLPQLGLVEVQLLDPDGSPLRADQLSNTYGELFVRNALVERPPLAPGPNILGVKRVEAQRVYAQIGLELEGIFLLKHPDMEANGRARGPQQAFESVVLPIPVGAQLPMVRMRLLADGKPYAEREVLVDRRRQKPGGSSSMGGPVGKTDSGGILCLPLQPADATTLTLLVLTDGDPASLLALVALPTLPQGGWLDLGDVLLEAPAVLVAGTVTDQAGVPIPDASLTVRGRLRPEFEVEQPEHMRAHLARFPFFGGPISRGRSDAQGHFELRGEALCVEYELRATAEGHARTDPLVCAAGTADVRIVMSVGGGLEGRVLLGPEMRAEDLQLSLETQSVPGVSDSGDSVNPPLAADGSWSATGLRPGKWKVSVKKAHVVAWDPLVPALQAHVDEGATTRVPDIDLSTGLRTLNIEVVDADGQPVAEAQGTFHGKGKAGNNDIEVRNGRATIVTRHAEIEAWLGGPGFLCEHVPDLRDGTRIVLKRASRIELQLKDLAALPPEPYTLCVQLDPGLGTDNWVLGEISRSSEAAFDRLGRASVELRYAGSIGVLVSVRAGPPGSNTRSESLSKKPNEKLKLAETNASGPVELAIDPAAVQAAVQKLSTP
jgi:hypothetical protein